MKHILIIDDNPTDCDLLNILLSRMGFMVTVRYNAMDAINSFNINRIDILVVDLQMPEISGLQLIESMRKNDKEIPIIVVSAYADEESKHKAFEIGATFYITKPYTSADIKRVFKQYL